MLGGEVKPRLMPFKIKIRQLFLKIRTNKGKTKKKKVKFYRGGKIETKPSAPNEEYIGPILLLGTAGVCIGGPINLNRTNICGT